jgi:group I intron endonuclease
MAKKNKSVKRDWKTLRFMCINEEGKFEIIELCEEKELITREQFWMDKTKCYDRNIGFNACIKADRPTGYKHDNIAKEKMSRAKLGTKQSKETIVKRSEKLKGRKHSEESKKYQSEIKLGSKNPMFGKEVSKETRDKISKANIGKSKGKKISEAHKKILSKTHKNKVRTFEEKLQQSQTLIQQYKDGKEPHQANLVLNTQTGVFYNSILEASKFYHIKYTTLRAMIMGQNPNTSPFIYC